MRVGSRKAQAGYPSPRAATRQESSLKQSDARSKRRHPTEQPYQGSPPGKGRDQRHRDSKRETPTEQLHQSEFPTKARKTQWHRGPNGHARNSREDSALTGLRAKRATCGIGIGIGMCANVAWILL